MSKQATAAKQTARLAILLLLAGWFVLSGMLIARAQSAASLGKSAAADPVVIDSEGYQKLLEKHRGKPVVINFWATWCEPCRDEFPMLSELARQHAPQGLIVMGVSLDEDVDINLVRRFLARMNPVFTNYRKKPGKDETFINGVDLKWSGALPATFFYDREGRKVASLVGEHQRPEFDKIIQQMMSASAPAAARATPKSAP